MLPIALITARTLAFALALTAAAATSAEASSAEASSASATPAAGTFDEASRLYQSSRWEEAAAAFDRFLNSRVGPVEFAAAHYFAAECFTQLGEMQTALDRYQKLLDGDPPEPYRSQSQFRLGEAAWKLGAADLAKTSLQAFTATASQSEYLPFAWCYLGEIAAAQQNWQKAIDDYSRVVEEYPRHPRRTTAQLGIANALIAQDRPQAALDILPVLADSADESVAPAALLAMSRAQFTTNDYAAAVETARELRARFPNAVEIAQARIVAGWALWKLERFEQIEAWLTPIAAEAGLASESVAAEVQILRGMTAYAQEDWARAGELLAQAAELAPRRLNLAFYAGESLRRAATGVGAETWLQRTLEGAPKGPWADDALWSLAQLAAAAGEADRAESRLNQLHAKFPNSPYSASDFAQQATRQARLLVEAVSLERDGRYGAALAAYQELNDLPPGEQNGEALWRHAQLLERLERHAEAATLLQRLIANFPAQRRAAPARLALAYRAAEQHAPEAAWQQFRDIEGLHPNTPQAAEAACWLAGRLIEQGKLEEARKQLSKVLGSEGAERQEIVQHAQHLQMTIEIAEQDWAGARLAALQLQKLADDGPLGLTAEFWLAESEFRLGNDEAARAAFEAFALRAAGLDESLAAMAPLRIAQLAARRQRWSQVLETLAGHEKKYPLFALHHEVEYLRGRALAGRGKMRAARAAYRRVLTTPAAQGSETAAMAQWMIGETFFHQENYEAARRAYCKVIEHHEQPAWQARAALQAGKCCELLNEWEAAAECYRRAPQSDADADARQQLQARLQWTQTRLARSSAVSK